MIATVRPARKLEGSIRVPGDKSISHRALILGSIAAGESHARGLSAGADVQSTAACMRALGVQIDGSAIRGVGMKGLRAARGPLDCGNSGTTMRLLAGLLAGQDFESELAGDESLSRRPMDRVVGPLREMGSAASWPPLRVGGGTTAPYGVEYHAPVPSAQVKSAILLAGLYAEGTTSVVETVKTRDHTEVMLAAMGADVTVDGLRVEVERAESLQPIDIDVPGDFSAAAFWIVAAVLAKSRVRLPGVGVNPTRVAFMRALNDLGCDIRIANERVEANELVGDIFFGTSHFSGPVAVGGHEAAEMIDELPALAVLATQIPGTSVIAGVAELRVKESDRLEAMAEGLSAMGADITIEDDGWIINGPRLLEGARVDSCGDHRIAMALAIAGLMAYGKTEIEGAECVDISYPGFFDHLEYLA